MGEPWTLTSSVEWWWARFYPFHHHFLPADIRNMLAPNGKKFLVYLQWNIVIHSISRLYIIDSKTMNEIKLIQNYVGSWKYFEFPSSFHLPTISSLVLIIRIPKTTNIGTQSLTNILVKVPNLRIYIYR